MRQISASFPGSTEIGGSRQGDLPLGIVAGTATPEVDSVLTSGEVQQLLEAHGRSLGDIPQSPLDCLVPGVPEDGRLYGLPGGSGAQYHCSYPLQLFSKSSPVFLP
jgi:hypothetical protein